MGLFEKNELVRLLEQLTQRLAAIQGLAAGGNPNEALASIREARAALAGPLASTLERVDGATVVALLGAERAGVYAKLSRLESDARAALGEAPAARETAARAAEIEDAL